MSWEFLTLHPLRNLTLAGMLAFGLAVYASSVSAIGMCYVVGYICVDEQTFSAPAYTGDWVTRSGNLYQQGSVTLGSETIDGALVVEDTYGTLFSIEKTWAITEAGRYRLIGSAAYDIDWWISNLGINITILGVDRPNGQVDTLTFPKRQTKYNFWSDFITVTAPTQLRIRISPNGMATFENHDLKFVFDHLTLARLDMLPEGSGTPTATPFPMQATPMPTADCRDIPAVTPTPEPTTAAHWMIVEHFQPMSGYWSFRPFGSAGSGGRNHYSSAAGETSAQITLQSNISGSASSVLTNGVAYSGTLPTFPAFIYGWARDDLIQSGEHTYIVVWWWEDGTWNKEAAIEIGVGDWYPWSATISPNAATNRIAVTAYRTDGNTSDNVFLDDIYVYGISSLQPYCDGSTSRTDINPINNKTSGSPGSGAIGITWPYDKPCPPPVDRPNNFWGGMLAQLTLLLDRFLAFAPQASAAFDLPSLTREILASPAISGAAIITVFVDPTIPILCLVAYLTVLSGQGVLDVLLWMKKIIPFF